jgi:hypothetical protein
MNPEKKREFTPYVFGVSYAEANPWTMDNYEIEEIASTFYTRGSKPYKFFIEGFTKVMERSCKT